MATVTSNLPSPTPTRETFMGDLAGMFSFFIDPNGAARVLSHRWFWVAPLIFTSICSIAYTLGSAPLLHHFMETAPLPPNITPEQYARTMQIQTTIYRALVYVLPVFAIVGTAIQAGVLFGLSSVAALRAKFLQLFNLVAGCSVITALQVLAWLVILKAKGDISSATDLKPPLGLDILMPPGTNKFLLATLGYFSLFQIWWIVMAVAVYSAAFGTGKGKAATVVLPLVLLGLLLTLFGTIFQKA